MTLPSLSPSEMCKWKLSCDKVPTKDTISKRWPSNVLLCTETQNKREEETRGEPDQREGNRVKRKGGGREQRGKERRDEEVTHTSLSDGFEALAKRSVTFVRLPTQVMIKPDTMQEIMCAGGCAVRNTCAYVCYDIVITIAHHTSHTTHYTYTHTHTCF